LYFPFGALALADTLHTTDNFYGDRRRNSE
jgi:hypothetical protein